MNLERIKKLSVDDFHYRKHGEKVWKAIETLSFSEVQSLIGHWGNEEIDNNLKDVINEKSEEIVMMKLQEAFKDRNDFEAFKKVFSDRILAVEIVRKFIEKRND